METNKVELVEGKTYMHKSGCSAKIICIVENIVTFKFVDDELFSVTTFDKFVQNFKVG